MKQSTKLLLLALLRADSHQANPIQRKMLEILLSALTVSGRNSLFRLLETRKLITNVSDGNHSQYMLTSLGMSKLLTEFPSLQSHWSQWRGDWKILVFCKPPKGDPQFRFLRKQCIANKGLALSRGIYLFAREIPAEINLLQKNMYPVNVSVMSISSWDVGLDPSIVIAQNGLHNLGNLYSGVSKEIDQLLASIAIEKGLTNAQKQITLEIYNRVVSILEIDPGYTRYYYPSSVSPPEVVVKLQKVLQ